MNKNLSKQFISTFDPIKINKARTLLDKEKKDVVKKLTTGLTNRKITDTIDSAIELHCSGHIDLVLKKLFNYYYSEINMAQPQCIDYIYSFTCYYNKTYDYEKCIGYEISNLESSDIDTTTDLPFQTGRGVLKNLEFGIVIGELDDKSQFIANILGDQSLLKKMTELELLGMKGEVICTSERNIFKPEIL